MWYSQTDTIIFTWIPFISGSIIYQLKVRTHFEYLKVAYGSFQDIRNYLHYALTKISSGQKDMNESIQIAFPIYSRDRNAERTNPELRKIGNRLTLYTILTWLILIYIFIIGFNSENRTALTSYLETLF